MMTADYTTERVMPKASLILSCFFLFRGAIKQGVSTFTTFASITTNDSCPNYQNK